MAEAGGRATWVFHRDGTFNAVDDMGMAVSGRIILPGENSIRFEIKRDGDSPEMTDGSFLLLRRYNDIVLIRQK